MVIPVAGVFCLLGAFGWAALRRYFEPGSMALAGVGLVLFLLGFVRAELANLRYYVQTGLYTVFVLGICVSAFMLARRHDVRADLSAQQRHTLSESTLSYLGVLKKDVDIYVFDVEREPYKLLDRFAEVTPRVEWTLHNPRRDPEFTRQFDANVAEGSIYIQHGEKRKRIGKVELDESAIISAIVEVTRDREITVYFLEGHGELAFERSENPEAEEIPSLSAFREFLATRAMKVAPLNLADRGYIPEDATLLVLAGPTRDLMTVEAQAIEQYLSEGGHLLVMVDLPQTNVSIDFSNLDGMLRRRGLADDERVIVDFRGQKTEGNPFMIPLATYNAQHPIGRPMTRTGGLIHLPLVRAFQRAEKAPREYTLTPIVESSEEAWTQSFTELFVAQAQPQLKPPTRDAMEPQAIGWAIERADGSGERIVVYGSSLPVMNGYVNIHDTAARLMLNTVNWLVRQDDLVAAPPKIIPGTPLMLTNAELQLILILIVMAFPLSLLFGGTVYTRVIRRS
jgi:hypothetical protein